MDNKEFLSNHNERLNINNTMINTISSLIHRLPDSEPDPILQDKSIEITENGITNIVADEGYDGLGNIEVITDVQNDASTTSAMYLIENGIENRDITQGYTFEDFVAQVANANAVKQMDASFNMYSGLWARGNVTFNADFDFTQCKKMYIEYEFPATDLISSMHQYMDVTVRLLDQAGETLTAVQIVGGRTVNRTTVEIPLDDINQVGKVFFSSSNLSGTNRDGNSSYSEAYPVRFFNVWFDVIDAAPVLQDKIIDVTENGTIIVTPDSDYDGLSSVEVNVNVESSGGGKIIPMSISFSGYKGTEQPGINNLDISNITSLYRMFVSCSNLTELNLSNWNTNDVTNTSGLVYGCTNLKNLDLSNWNTSNVTDMKQMFYACRQLKELDLSSFDTGKVTDMSEMFCDCGSLTKLDIRNFNFSNVTSSTNIFGSQNYPNTWVPASCEIIVKDDTAKAWVLARSRSGFTNVKTVAEL